MTPLAKPAIIVTMLKPTDYLLTPRDIIILVRSMTVRDWSGVGLVLALTVVVTLWLSDLSAGLFAAGLLAALYWRIDSRWPLGMALVCLVLIPLFQLAFDYNLIFWGQAIGQGLAVAVWYLLAIGVVRQVVELARQPAAIPVAASPVPAPAAPLLPAPAPSPPAPVPVPRSLRHQRMAERRGQEPPSRAHPYARPQPLDGLRRRPG